MKHSLRLAAAALLCSTTAAASAHTGHGTESLFAGLVHPFGLDHLVAALAIGAWSAAALPAGRRVIGPLLFLGCLLAGALAGAALSPLPMLETSLAASVALLGAMLIAPRALPLALGIAMLACASALHGVAHGAEWTAGSFAAYAAGFITSTALLQAAGLAAGRWMLQARQWVWRSVAAAGTVAGVLMLAPA
jgi:urease accessory protein